VRYCRKQLLLGCHNILRILIETCVELYLIQEAKYMKFRFGLTLNTRKLKWEGVMKYGCKCNRKLQNCPCWPYLV
jgi:hypothetical protein